MPWTVILNPAAGRGRARLSRAALERALSSYDARLEVSESGADAISRAEKAAAGGRDLVAAGGDGTVGALAGVATVAGVRLAIVPGGSGNDIATALGYDRKAPLRAVTVLDDAGGTDATIDLARARTADGTTRWFVSVSACGFDSEANRWANTSTRLSGTALYVVAVLRTLATYRPQPFRIAVDGEEGVIGRAWLVAVGNGPSYGGGMRITPQARFDDGLLDCCVITDAINRPRFLRHFPKVFTGRHVTMPEVQTRQGRVVHIESLDGGRVPIELYADGERVGPLPATIVARPAALVARVPRSSPLIASSLW